MSRCQYGVIDQVKPGTYRTNDDRVAVVTEVNATGSALGVLHYSNGWFIRSWLEDGCAYKVYNHGWKDSESLSEFVSADIPPDAALVAQDWERIKKMRKRGSR